MADRKGRPLSHVYNPTPPRDDGGHENVPYGTGENHRGQIHTEGRRGIYNKKLLPEDFIRELDAAGFGAKAITNRIRGMCGAPISYKTVQRVLSGERKQPEQISLV